MKLDQVTALDWEVVAEGEKDRYRDPVALCDGDRT